ncbi:DUF397 domain-containing protein [Streptomyces neyagawaensis]|uniref:DUF397 domain-containing protein n=1 Tax=Streptomyces neyagawaensis TaxID=42238 RepID=A0ABV3B167_9ACTN
MPHVWQKSTYSGDASNCVHIAAHPATGTVLLHESDTPGTVLTTSPAPLGQLISALKEGWGAGRQAG